jgi:hypothetical protein
MEFVIDEKMRAWGKANNYNVEAQLDFYNYYISYRPKRPYKCLEAAFRNCVRSDWGNIRKQALKDGSYWPKQRQVESKPVNGLIWDTQNLEWVRA